MPKKMTIKKTTIKKSALCKLRRHSKRKPHRKHSSRKYGGTLRKKINSKRIKRRGGGIIPSGITQIGYSISSSGLLLNVPFDSNASDTANNSFNVSSLL
jgi:hypothetical protein